jgi:hypothetical protein
MKFTKNSLEILVKKKLPFITFIKLTFSNRNRKNYYNVKYTPSLHVQSFARKYPCY